MVSANVSVIADDNEGSVPTILVVEDEVLVEERTRIIEFVRIRAEQQLPPTSDTFFVD
ncbi:hypothetical protein GCM10011322_47980 [Salinarimonas ramus]|uniref:Uncharacterized protein n=1 Tax=Salinarimonas ramus TaxID=690164 RepID=A0A917QM13_9HYPH|nr:hypothetical protein GCM10011322_47980 [Salinarimonas ramus]